MLGVTVNFDENFSLSVFVMFKREKMWGKSERSEQANLHSKITTAVFSITALKMCLSHITSTLYITLTLGIIILPSEQHVVSYFLREPCIQPGDAAQVHLKFPEGS